MTYNSQQQTVCHYSIFAGGVGAWARLDLKYSGSEFVSSPCPHYITQLYNIIQHIVIMSKYSLGAFNIGHAYSTNILRYK